MSTLPFNIKKWTVRCLLSIGALLGFSSCFHPKSADSPSSAEAVYGPPPEEYNQSVEPIDSPQVYEEPMDTPRLNNQEPQPVKVVYGPRPNYYKDVEPVEDVYGPPIDENED